MTSQDVFVRRNQPDFNVLRFSIKNKPVYKILTACDVIAKMKSFFKNVATAPL